ncbi:MAG: ABC transporter substrate-binding protein, partial [Ruoffia tabacinasalis]
MNFKKLGLSLLAGVTLFASSSNLLALAQEENETVKIGANMETSGYSASYGQAMYEALQLAVEEVNNEGGLLDGLEVEIIHYDNKSDKTETASVATRLVEEGAVALIGPGATDLVLAQN